MSEAKTEITEESKPDQELSTFTSVVGLILGVSYPLLAISALARSSYQLFFKVGVTNYVAPTLTLVAALLYLVATVGFAYRRPWSWRLSVAALGLEAGLTLLVGTLSLLIPATIGRTVWANFGIDYAFFPLIQPILGLIWLTRPSVKHVFGVSRAGG